MTLTLADVASEPGRPERANEDAYCCDQRLAAVVDGATGLGEPLLPGRPSDAAWLAGGLADRLTRTPEDNGGRDRLRAVLRELEAEFEAERRRPPIETYEYPLASLIMIEHRWDGVLEAMWFGDCSALVALPGGRVVIIGDAFERRAREAEQAARLISSKANLNREDTDVIVALRSLRNRYNKPSGPWLVAPDPQCADYGTVLRRKVPTGSHVLLATDGFLALCTDYRCYTAHELIHHAIEGGLSTLLEELRSIEREDAEASKFPRFKASDDATAMLVTISP